MTKEMIIRKLTSRKFWMAVAGFITGLMVALGETAETAEAVAGLIMSGATVLGYLLAEGLTDAAEAGADTVIQIGAEEMAQVLEKDIE